MSAVERAMAALQGSVPDARAGRSSSPLDTVDLNARLNAYKWSQEQTPRTLASPMPHSTSGRVPPDAPALASPFTQAQVIFGPPTPVSQISFLRGAETLGPDDSISAVGVSRKVEASKAAAARPLSWETQQTERSSSYPRPGVVSHEKPPIQLNVLHNQIIERPPSPDSTASPAGIDNYSDEADLGPNGLEYPSMKAHRAALLAAQWRKKEARVDEELESRRAAAAKEEQARAARRLVDTTNRLQEAEDALRTLQLKLVAEKLRTGEAKRLAAEAAAKREADRRELALAVAILRRAKDDGRRGEEERQRLLRAFEEAKRRLVKYHEEIRVRDARKAGQTEGRTEGFAEAGEWMTHEEIRVRDARKAGRAEGRTEAFAETARWMSSQPTAPAEQHTTAPIVVPTPVEQHTTAPIIVPIPVEQHITAPIVAPIPVEQFSPAPTGAIYPSLANVPSPVLPDGALHPVRVPIPSHPQRSHRSVSSIDARLVDSRMSQYSGLSRRQQFADASVERAEGIIAPRASAHTSRTPSFMSAGAPTIRSQRSARELNRPHPDVRHSRSLSQPTNLASAAVMGHQGPHNDSKYPAWDGPDPHFDNPEVMAMKAFQERAARVSRNFRGSNDDLIAAAAMQLPPEEPRTPARRVGEMGLRPIRSPHPIPALGISVGGAAPELSDPRYQRAPTITVQPPSSTRTPLASATSGIQTRVPTPSPVGAQRSRSPARGRSASPLGPKTVSATSVRVDPVGRYSNSVAQAAAVALPSSHGTTFTVVARSASPPTLRTSGPTYTTATKYGHDRPAPVLRPQRTIVETVPDVDDPRIRVDDKIRREAALVDAYNARATTAAGTRHSWR
ncbi:hypothetical protein CspeluHIS016_0307130 [Cutaneotrichosporon spelunceum]|uniref:Uncharacterized protein n=1 Tax=Cutaneotrichosporon spelunceum TaxID=1672016 RepID=A0AAD3YC91_9TREE|nr:hypothetical protein CspeluHIS016_0307130 [Cutaneotrichosporon spelunceum]